VALAGELVIELDGGLGFGEGLGIVSGCGDEGKHARLGDGHGGDSEVRWWVATVRVNIVGNIPMNIVWNVICGA
jgi:hypothetical protein